MKKLMVDPPSSCFVKLVIQDGRDGKIDEACKPIFLHLFKHVTWDFCSLLAFGTVKKLCHRVLMTLAFRFRFTIHMQHMMTRWSNCGPSPPTNEVECCLLMIATMIWGLQRRNVFQRKVWAETTNVNVELSMEFVMWKKRYNSEIGQQKEFDNGAPWQWSF